MADFRIEKDSIGEKQVPVEAYYGVQSLRGKENFKITGQKIHSEIIKSLAYIKKACIIANNKAGIVDNKIKDAVCTACDDIIGGMLWDEFIVDPIQGGAGTSLNMNANEVIANRAIEILGGQKGDYSVVHPNDHVNNGQSTNDIIPTAGKLTALVLLNNLITELETLHSALLAKAKEFDDVIKMGRTQMQDAVPIRLGQEFNAYASAISRDITRVKAAQESLSYINMGGTAIGTGINADEAYFKDIVPTLSKVMGINLHQADDLVDGTQNLDVVAFVSATLKTCAISLSKMSNDFRLMSSGPRTGFNEINLPAKQNGSSIMPGKVNPVIPEVMSQVAYLVMGNDVTITMASEAGQLELNAFEPVIFHSLYQSIDALCGGINTLTHNCVEGITANKERCAQMVENSVGIITAIAPHVGYAKSAEVAKKAIKTGEPVRKLAIESGYVTKEDLDIILDVKNMTNPGISGKELLKK